MKSDRRRKNIIKNEPSNVTMSSRYLPCIGDDKPDESVDLKIDALYGSLSENILIKYIHDERFKKEILLISSIT